MRNYEIIIMINPNQSEQISKMVEKYRLIIENQSGKIFRFEDWGRRPLAYRISKIHKAHYLLMNILSYKETIEELSELFRFNDSIIRYLILIKKNGITEPSYIMKEKEESNLENKN